MTKVCQNPVSNMSRPIAKRQALAARRAFYSATRAIDVIISGDLTDAEFVEAVQPFIQAAGMLPVRPGDG